MKARLYSFFYLFSCIMVSVTLVAGCSRTDSSRQNPKEVVVYTYDSFVSEWGPGPELTKRFQEATGYTLTLISCGDAAEVLSRARLEKKDPGADVLVGLDNNLVDQARSSQVLTVYQPKGAEAVISPELRLSEDWLLTPYDWGAFAFIFDTASGITPPSSLADLAKEEYRKKIILMDPRTSTPGLGFLAWTLAVYKDGYPDYWNSVKDNILTLAPGWDTGYGLFTAGEAPLVISYTTSPAYHLEFEQTERYKALVFPEGHTRQIEGLGLVKGAKNAAGAKAFIDFMITDAAQSVLPLTQWMYPVSKTVELPSSFRVAPVPVSLDAVDSDALYTAIDVVTQALGK